MGQKPSHPELLDWLAAELVDRGWSIKAMHRLMVTSSTYRMVERPAAATPSGSIRTNVYLHRMNVRRLEAEAIRDVAAGGLRPARADDVRAERADAPDQLHGRPRPSRHDRARSTATAGEAST